MISSSSGSAFKLLAGVCAGVAFVSFAIYFVSPYNQEMSGFASNAEAWEENSVPTQVKGARMAHKILPAVDALRFRNEIPLELKEKAIPQDLA